MLYESSPKEKMSWGGLVSTLVALFTALFTVMGFLATRSYIGGIGIPEHVNIPLDGYIQYGGRFFFVLAVHLLPVSFCAGVLFMIFIGLQNWWAWLRKVSKTGLYICLILTVVVFSTISLELLSLQPDPVFSAGHVRGVSGELRSKLYLIELGLAITITWLLGQFTCLWRGYRNTVFQKTVLTIVMLAVLVQVLLFPLCFGQIAMVPKSFNRVILRRENERATLKGTLVFSDKESYFLFTEDRQLVEVAHNTVKEIQYEACQLLQQLSDR